jgi:hypothetical protein
MAWQWPNIAAAKRNRIPYRIYGRASADYPLVSMPGRGAHIDLTGRRSHV